MQMLSYCVYKNNVFFHGFIKPVRRRHGFIGRVDGFRSQLGPTPSIKSIKIEVRWGHTTITIKLICDWRLHLLLLLTTLIESDASNYLCIHMNYESEVLPTYKIINILAFLVNII